MRVLFVCFALTFALALGACASTAATSPAAVSAPVGAATATPPPPASSRIGQLLAAAGRSAAPTQADIEHAMGPADITRRDGAGVALTYRLDHCALLLVFAANAQNQVRLADAHPSARDAGQAAPSLDQCAVEAIARHPS